MATFDQLSADQRAIIELLLQRGKSYDELAGLLGMPEDRVRELARDALIELTPVTAGQVEADWRGQLADYVLGQQTGPEGTATKGHLRRSEAARAWARSLLDSLDTLYGDGMPQVPAGERAIRARRERRQEGEDEARPLRSGLSLSPAAQEAVRRRRFLAGGAAALVVALLLVFLVWKPFSSGGDNDKSSQASAPSQPANNRGPAGIAVIAQRNNQRQVIVQARLTPNKQRQAYEVWLYNSKTDAKSLGAQVTDARGTYQGAGPLPSDYRRFKYIDVSREPIDQNRGHSGVSILRGKIPTLKQPTSTKKGQASILGQVVLRPVSG